VNRTVSVNMDSITPGALPPARREGPARALFIHGNLFGFKTVGRLIESYCAEREDLDAVHVHLRWPLWMRALGKSSPVRCAGWDLHAERYLLLWKLVMDQWFRGPLDLSRFDVMHVMTQGLALSTVAAKRRRPGLALALNIDATAVQQCREFGFSRIAKSYSVRSERRMFDAADLVVTRNEWAAGSLRSDLGLPEEKIHVASNSIPLTTEHKHDGVERQRSELPRIVFVGSWRRKGGDLLLRVHQERFADRAELHVFSSVPSPDRSARNVVWHGLAPREELLGRWLPSMDLFVLPSRDDMLPWAALEASAAGLPVVAADLGSIPQAVRDGETGLLFPPGDVGALGDAVGALLDDPVRRDAMGRAGRAHVAAKHDPDVTYPALLGRLARLADEVGGATP